MKKNLLLLSIIVLINIVLYSCSGTSNKNTITTNFDDLKSWNIANDAFTDKAARSGVYSIFTGSQKEFSLTYETKLDSLKAKGYSKLNASIWIKSPSSTKDVQWVAAINSPTGANYVWKSTYMSTNGETDQKGWKKISVQIDFPANAPDGVLKIYAWSPSKEEVILDDFELNFE